MVEPKERNAVMHVEGNDQLKYWIIQTEAGVNDMFFGVHHSRQTNHGEHHQQHGGVLSTHRSGVPQSSILGPLLF